MNIYHQKNVIVGGYFRISNALEASSLGSGITIRINIIREQL